MRHAVISCTKGKKEDTLLWKSVQKMKKELNYEDYFLFRFIEHNTVGLSKIYNSELKALNDWGFNSVIFIHDDVEITDKQLLSKLEDAYKKYDIVGLAGSLEPKIDEPCLWHLMSEKHNHRGEVGHIDDKGNKFITKFGNTPSRVCIIDGVFMAFNLDVIMPKKFKFDENFNFHHYDITVGLIANELKLKVGVYPISIYHASPGLRDYHNTEFQKSQKNFIMYYNSIYNSVKKI